MITVHPDRPEQFTVRFYKRPADVLDYRVLWGKWLGNDAIVDSEWSTPNNGGVTIQSHETSGSDTIVWLALGEDKNTYQVTNLITTAAGRQKEILILFELWTVT